MQYELRTQVIEARRKTFQNLTDRFGDRPASRYEEGSIDIQATENFHYRPTWAPDKELYDPAYSAFKLADPYVYTDPRQYYYTPYVTNRSAMHEAFGKTLDYLAERGLLEKLPENWAQLVAEVIPLRHYESGAQMISSGACRFAYGTTISQCCGLAAFDRVGLAQMLSRVGITVGGGTVDALTKAKTAWLEDDSLQGLRRYMEELFIEEDWAVGMIGLDLTDRMLYGVLYRHLDEAALMGGAGAYSLIAQHMASWFKDQRRWLDALYKVWPSCEQYGAANVAEFNAAVNRLLPKAVAAVRPIAERADSLVDAGCVAALDQIVEEIRSQGADLGYQIEEVPA